MQRIYKKIRNNAIEGLKQWLVLHEVNTLRESQDRVIENRMKSVTIRELSSRKFIEKTKIKLESTMSKLSSEQYEAVLSQAPPLGNNDLLKLIIDDAKISALYESVAANKEEHDFHKGKLAGIMEIEEEIEAKVGEYNKKNSPEKDTDFNRFDIISS